MNRSIYPSIADATGFVSGELDGIINALISAEDDRWKLRDLVEDLVSRKDLLERRCHDIVDRADRAERGLETELAVLRAECATLQAALAGRDRLLTEIRISNSQRSRDFDISSSRFEEDHRVVSPRDFYLSSPRHESFSNRDSRFTPTNRDLASTPISRSRFEETATLSPESSRKLEEMNSQLKSQEEALQQANRKIEENNSGIADLLRRLDESNSRLREAHETIARQQETISSLTSRSSERDLVGETAIQSSNVSKSTTPDKSNASNDNSRGKGRERDGGDWSAETDEFLIVDKVPSLFDRTLETMVEKDDIDAVIGMMRASPEIESKQQNGCIALTKLADKPENAANRAAIGNKGGIAAVISAMNLHSTSPRVAQSANQTLHKLAVAAANRKKIGQSGAIPLIVEAMKLHSGDPRVQEHGCAALSMLAQNNASNRARITQAGGIAAVAAAMRLHNADPVVQLIACAAIVKLALAPEETGKLTESLRRVAFEDGTYIISQGEEGKHFYIIADGNAVVRKRDYDGGPERDILTLNKGQYFGEVALLRDEPRAASVVAIGAVKCLCMNQDDFRKLLGEHVSGGEGGRPPRRYSTASSIRFVKGTKEEVLFGKP